MSTFFSFARFKTLLSLSLLLWLAWSTHAYAQVSTEAPTIDWQLYSIDDNQRFNEDYPEGVQYLPKADNISLVGGHYLYAGDFSVDKAGYYVIDFKNTSAIDWFVLYLYDSQNTLIAKAEGGIGNDADNPFFMRHGRKFDLPAGQYQLIAEVNSPYYIAQPEPYINRLDAYQKQIRLGDAIVLIGIGIFLAMGIYYGALSFVSSRKTEIFYALFIFSNLLFNSGAHLLLSQVFGWHNFYLVSFPILISNLIYILFVMRLLEIHQAKNKRLYHLGNGALALLALFALYGMLNPNWINEMARFGVWVFLLYGLIAGIGRSMQGSVVARLYLVALSAFIGLASMATIPTTLSSNSINVEHYGLAAIAVEIVLLALVLTYQVGELYRERMNILLRLDRSKKMAHTDAATQIPNRYALEIALASFDQHSSLIYIDMDNLKYYNDRYGHAKGDEMLAMFAKLMLKGLGNNGCIYRVGGDEFAVTCPDGNVTRVELLITRVIEQMQEGGFKDAGASYGVAYMHEVANTSDLKHLADLRMYERKQQRQN
ncbi:diguanylate cyclase [Thiomicrorhabdus sediminis]|uniref:diguanylate cyclase n=1 Tax=Thiomicrorhabdus sediminis TaxID=2580412 RepID=A0A4P9K724_9GAMM|nr:diguanylate cyclase [Thiomicrorhabdus sediminis]QCU90047.1 diguanylate cyclase [Thiomicrorhabdus sediminis]